MDIIKEGNRAILYALALHILPFLVLEGVLGVAIYFSNMITGIAVFLHVVIAILMGVVAYFCIIRPIVICKTYKITIKEGYVEVYYRVFTEQKVLTPLHGKTTYKERKLPFVRDLYKIILINGEHRFVVNYLSGESANKVKETVYDRA